MATQRTTKTNTKKPTSAPRTTRGNAAAVEATEPAVAGSQEDYDRFIGDALALDEREVVPYRADASVAHHNVLAGLSALLARETEASALPSTDVERIKQLPSQCLAVAFAARQVNDRASGELGSKLARASALRRMLLRAADSLADAGIFREKDVAAIRQGSGKMDLADDCVALAALFTKYAPAIRGKTAITPDQVKEAATVGRDLLALLKPRAAKKTRSTEAKTAADARDRLWTLVKQGYDQLWRACAYLYGPDEIDDRVPALQAHVATTSARKKANAAKRQAKKAVKQVGADAPA